MPITKEKTTGDLEGEIKASKSIDEYLVNNSDHLIKQSTSETLNEALYRTGMSVSDVIRRCGLTRSHVYHIFNGNRLPSRDKLIAIAFGLGLDCEETNTLLKKCRFAPLYPKDGRDAVIIFGLTHGKDIIETNINLADKNYDILK